jgi:hypothetical protein
MSQIVRFVEIQRDSVEIKEAFIDFIPLDAKISEIITAEITKKLERDGLNLEDCRGQSCDNQATTASVHFAVKKRILDLIPLAIFFPCNNHSLSLVGVHAARVNVQALTFWNCGTSVWLLFTFNSSVECFEILCQYYSEAPF